MRINSLKTLTLSILMAVPTTTLLAQRSDTEMETIAARQLQGRTSGAQRIGSSVGLKSSAAALRCLRRADTYSIYAPEAADGFVIVARNESVSPVLGYGDGRLDADNMPADMQWWLSLVERNLAKGEAVNTPRKALEYKPVANFVTARWSQERPYNMLTPLISGSNAPVGCVATAMAQCMNVFKYPASASFESVYYVQGGRQSATVNSTYSWDYSDSYGTSLRAGKKIAQLMVDCGYAVSMQYDKDGSGTYNFFAGEALINCFGYPEECVKFRDRYVTSDEEWYGIIYSELQKGSPIIYGGHDPSSGGHAFVLSGIDANGLVYVNWGWSGDYNGFYAIDLMNPVGASFSESQDMVFGIRSQALPTDHVEGYISMVADTCYTFKYEPYVRKEYGIDVQKCIQVTLPIGFINFNATTMQGEFGLFALDQTDGTEWVVAETDRDTIPPAYGLMDEKEPPMFFYDVADLKVGHTYRMSFGAKDDRDTRWRSFLCTGGEIAYDVVVNADGTATITGPVAAATTVTGTTGVRSIGTDAAADGITHVYDLNGRQVYAAPSASFNQWDIPVHGVLIVSDGKHSRKVVR